jgi:putative membrane protein
MTSKDIISTSSASDPSLELVSRNTELAVQRARMSADRILMSVVSASLALVGFGFTIAQIFQNLDESKALQGDAIAGRHFGITLVLVGILMLTFGILYRLAFMLSLRRARRQLLADGVIRGASSFPVSLTLITAVILLGISVATITSTLFHIGPF